MSETQRTPADDLAEVSHRVRRINAPVSAARLAGIVQQVAAARPARIVDLGCGTGEWLLEMLGACGAEGVGVDTDAGAVEEAARRARSRQLEDRVQWLERKAADYAAGAAANADVAICVGASHALGGYAATLSTMRGLVRPGGLLLVGEGYWERAPVPEYLEFLGGEEDLGTHMQKVQIAEDLGLVTRWASTASLSEWDDFEWGFFQAALAYAEQYPGPASDAVLQKRKAWRDGYLRWGRGTMGFGYYLFSRSPD